MAGHTAALKLKRTLDVVGAACGGLFLGPMIAAVAFLVRARNGHPIVFKQNRPGLHGDVFPLYKFRTMTHERNADGKLLSDAERLTSLGSVLRRWSLDELPELWNVLRGDMSLVGPRPLMPEYLRLYSQEQARRHEVRPGITGLAQVLDRNETTWERRLGLDVWYVENWSVWLDLKILGMTVAKVVSREGIAAPGYATMPRFNGLATDPKAENDEDA